MIRGAFGNGAQLVLEMTLVLGPTCGLGQDSTFAPLLNGPNHGPSGPDSPAHQPISHLSDEGMSDFPVIPVSRSKIVTHCSLPAIIAMAWAWGQITYDQQGTRDLWPRSPSLWNIISTVSGISSQNSGTPLPGCPPSYMSGYHREWCVPGWEGAEV